MFSNRFRNNEFEKLRHNAGLKIRLQIKYAILKHTIYQLWIKREESIFHRVNILSGIRFHREPRQNKWIIRLTFFFYDNHITNYSYMCRWKWMISESIQARSNYSKRKKPNRNSHTDITRQQIWVDCLRNKVQNIELK